MYRFISYFGFALCFLLCWSCATFYQTNYTFNRKFELGDLEGAERALEKAKNGKSGKERFLYFVNLGVVHAMQGQYEESNAYFEKAYLFGEDHRTDYVLQAASYLTNPNVTVYKGEDHEHLLLLYYKAINFLKLNKMEEALVECRRLNIRLQQLSDKYKSSNKYKRDGFIHNLMGIIYETGKDYNNAFIAYRNALNIYNTDFNKLFGMEAPDQLKKDILRTAFLTGLKEEYEAFKKEFDMPDYQYSRSEGGELIFIWHNGLGPVKSEWGINFAAVKGAGGYFHFRNDQYGFDFPFLLEDGENSKGLEDLKFFRVAFPKYVERVPLYHHASLSVGNSFYPLQKAQDTNGIAFKVLNERMVAEFSKALIRVAMKKVNEHALQKSNEGLGTALGLFNALTEKADTRNWQTIPHSIHYARVPLQPGQNKIKFEVDKDFSGNNESILNFYGEKGKTIFHTFSSLETAQNYAVSY